MLLCLVDCLPQLHNFHFFAWVLSVSSYKSPSRLNCILNTLIPEHQLTLNSFYIPELILQGCVSCVIFRIYLKFHDEIIFDILQLLDLFKILEQFDI